MPLSQLEFPQIAGFSSPPYPWYLLRIFDPGLQLHVKSIGGIKDTLITIDQEQPYTFTGKQNALYIPRGPNNAIKIKKVFLSGSESTEIAAINDNVVNIPVTTEWAAAANEILICSFGSIATYTPNLNLVNNIVPANPKQPTVDGNVVCRNLNYLMYVTGRVGANISFAAVDASTGNVVSEYALPLLHSAFSDYKFTCNNNGAFVTEARNDLIGNPVSVYKLLFTNDGVMQYYGETLITTGGNNNLRGFVANDSMLILGLNKNGNIPGPSVDVYTFFNEGTLTINNSIEIQSINGSSVQAISR